MNIFTKILIFIFATIGTSFANEIKVFNFTKDELSKLEVRKVRGAENKTIYTIGSNENGNFLKAVADNAASGLGKEVKIDLNKTPFINITWKIEKDLPGIKEYTKKGHVCDRTFTSIFSYCKYDGYTKFTTIYRFCHF